MLQKYKIHPNTCGPETAMARELPNMEREAALLAFMDIRTSLANSSCPQLFQFKICPAHLSGFWYLLQVTAALLANPNLIPTFEPSCKPILYAPLSKFCSININLP